MHHHHRAWRAKKLFHFSGCVVCEHRDERQIGAAAEAAAASDIAAAASSGGQPASKPVRQHGILLRLKIVFSSAWGSKTSELLKTLGHILHWTIILLDERIL